MRRLIALTIALGLFMALAGSAAAVNGLKVESENVFDLDDLIMEVENPKVYGEAHILRTSLGVFAKVELEGLRPGDIYTLWWEVFNKPKKCGVLDPGGCGIDLEDFSAGRTGFDIGYAAGGKVKKDGTLKLIDWLPKGQDLKGFPEAPVEIVDFVVPVHDAKGLRNIKGAQIDLVLRQHGQPVPGMVKSMKTTYNGGCQYGVAFSASDGAQPRFGLEGPRICVDHSIAIFAGS